MVKNIKFKDIFKSFSFLLYEYSFIIKHKICFNQKSL